MIKSQQLRLIRYLDDCRTVEGALIPELQRMARESTTPVVRVLLNDQATASESQEQRLVSRLRALDADPARTPGFFNEIASLLSGLPDEPDDHADLPTQFLLKAFAFEQFKRGLYEALASYSASISDEDTKALAHQTLAAATACAGRLWTQIGVEARRPVGIPDRIDAVSAS